MGPQIFGGPLEKNSAKVLHVITNVGLIGSVAYAGKISGGVQGRGSGLVGEIGRAHV